MADVRAGQLISTILRHDRRTTSYKLALMRSLNDLALGYSHLAVYDAAVAVPLRRLAVLWVGYYWPFVDPEHPIAQGHHPAGRQDITFRPALSRLRQLWGDLVGTVRPSDGFYLSAELLTPHRRQAYPAPLQAAFDAAVRAIVHALHMPIRYAGPTGEHGVFAPPRRWRELQRARPQLVCLPGTLPGDSCLVVEAPLWQGLVELSLWIEALYIHEWCLFTESVAGVDRGLVYRLLTDRPDNRRPLTWERNQVELLMLEGHRFTCPWSGVLLTPSSYDLDHLLPISVYPLNESWNLVPAERHFNQHIKRNRLPSPKRRQQAYPHLVAAYNHYLASPALEPTLRADAVARFNGAVDTADFAAALAQAALILLGTMAQARSLPTF